MFLVEGGGIVQVTLKETILIDARRSVLKRFSVRALKDP